MPRFSIALFAAIATCSCLAHARETREIDFPDTREGERILAVDPHTHSVFSDGHVWPTVRVWEAEKDDLDAFMVTEHLEYQPHRDDIPHPDRNRSLALALEGAERAHAQQLVISGSEITRSFPPGHINAVFIKDANALLVDDWREAIKAAKAQGAFTFWNHSWWPRDFPNGVVKLSAAHRGLIRERLLDGIEVANGDSYSDEAFKIALENDLAVIGVSDIHGLVDYDYDIAGGEQRTVTLVVAEEKSEAAIKKAFEAHRTAALYRHTLIGREREVRAIVEGALSLEPGNYIRNGSTILNVVIRNGSSTPFSLQNIGLKGFNDAGAVITVPAHGEVSLDVKDVSDKGALSLDFEILNTLVAPRRHLAISLKG